MGRFGNTYLSSMMADLCGGALVFTRYHTLLCAALSESCLEFSF